MKIYMTGVGIVLFIITLLVSIRIYGKKFGLQLGLFWKRLPRFLVIRYAFSQYTRYLIEHQQIIPLSRDALLAYISPYGYTFHIVGLIIALVVIRWWIRTYIINANALSAEHAQKERYARLDMFFHAFALACIPLGVFLVLGDNFIGMTTHTNFYVSAIRSDSAMAIYGKVIPLGVFLSCWGLIMHLAHTLLSHQGGYTHKRILIFYAVFSLGIAWLLTLQQYPRHFVTHIMSLTLDIKQYALLAVAILCLIKFWRERKISPGGLST